MQLEYFQMIDRVEALDLAAKRITCRASVPAQSTVFEGHFPGHPLLPGVLMVESIAQSSGYLLLAANGFSRMPFLARIEQAKLRGFVEPRAELIVAAELVHVGSGFAVTRGSIVHEDKKVAEAELRFRTVAFPSDEFRRLTLEAAGRLGLDTGAAQGAALGA